MELIVTEKERQRYHLQHQEEEEVKMPSDEEKNVTHRFGISGFWLLVADHLESCYLLSRFGPRPSGSHSYLITNGYRS